MLSLVVPVRDWPTARIQACIESYTRLKSAALTEIVVVDFGSAEPVVLDKADRRVRVVRVEANAWSLAEANNVGVVSCSNPVVAKTDADIIVAPNSGRSLDRIARLIANGEISLAVARTFDLPPGIGPHEALSAKVVKLTKLGRLRARWGLGGLCIFDIDIWKQIGGFDARFTGWGTEDNDFVDRLRRAGGKSRWADTQNLRVFHVWHEASYLSLAARETLEKNRRIYRQDRSVLRRLRFPTSGTAALSAPQVAKAFKPMVTIAIGTRARKHRDRMLAEAIASFAGQADSDFEVLVADNGSSDDEHESLKSALDRLALGLRLRYLQLERGSIPGARNRITDEAAGRYICVADDDDLAMRNRLTDHLRCFERDGGLHGSHGGWIDFEESNGRVERNQGKPRTLGSMLFGKGKITAHSASFYRRDVLQAVRYDESFVTGSDWDLALRLANLGFRVGHTGTYVTLRRFHAENITYMRSSEQVLNGEFARRRIHQTLGTHYLEALKADTATKDNVLPCSNIRTDADLLECFAPEFGVWRILVPVEDLSVAFTPSATGSPKSAGGSAAPDSNNPVPDIFELLDGDVGPVDCGLNPQLHFISEPLHGAQAALASKAKVEASMGVRCQIVSDAELLERRTAGFDWAKLANGNTAHRLISPPFENLDDALTLIDRVPRESLARAVLSTLVDAVGDEQRFYVITHPLAAGDKSSPIVGQISEFTGIQFDWFDSRDRSTAAGAP